ncbi:hypothetical protein Tsubulata_049309 [Turnera subulata]|uniref:Zinc knuckle CX2CX4HX4C domain-containing protein n=1 Tax=Turnera subulata TaxID=218843 RepID=A0A9Q0FNW7_9ROSI|nr:hypothetical protein Tsubulata_049309 [Turnera subulata]
MTTYARLVIDLRASQDPHDVPEETSLGSIFARTYAVGAFRVIPKPNSIFLIGFEHEEDCKHVLKGSPWLVSNLHFCLKPWIKFVVDQPLRPGVHVLDSQGKEIWIKFKYERLGEFCFRCGLISHATYKCKKAKRANEGKELPVEDSYGPWMRAKEVYGKHYFGQKSFSKTTPYEPNDANLNPPPDNAVESPYIEGTAPGSSCAGTPGDVHRKRKASKDPSLSHITESAKKHHTEVVQVVAEIVEELDTNTPVSKSASCPSWKRLARSTQVPPHTSVEEWVKAYEKGETYNDGMGVVEPIPFGDPRGASGASSWVSSQVTDGEIPAVGAYTSTVCPVFGPRLSSSSSSVLRPLVALLGQQSRQCCPDDGIFTV